ncbi:MAG: response regulator [Anaerolineales bacterium]|nr:response regulator [Anaerolineales bacterium]
MKTVLHIENDPDCLELSRIVLERNGYRYQSASSSAFSLLLIEQTPPDLIILAAQLPNQSGLEVARILRAHPAAAHTPLMFFCQDHEYRSLVQQLPAEDQQSFGHITLPTTYQDFLNGITAAFQP